MIANNPMNPVCEYATDSQYKEAPNQEQLSCGVIPLDSLPAEWWNYLWGNANQQINNGVVALNNVIAEIINVMSAAGISPVSECTDQLKTSIQLLAQCIGTSTKAGAVKSSDTCGQVSISNAGIMTANGLGNASNLTTTNKGNVVAAINELKAQHEQQITDLESYVQGLQTSTVTGVKLTSSDAVISPTSGIINLGLGSAAKCDLSCFLSTESLAAYAKQNGYFTGASDSWVCCSCDSARLVGSSATYTADDIKSALDGKAPTNHATSSTTYGVASSTNYGHVKFQSPSYTVIGKCCYSSNQFGPLWLTDIDNPTCICLRWDCNCGGNIEICTCCKGVCWRFANVYASTPLLNLIDTAGDILGSMYLSERNMIHLCRSPSITASIKLPACSNGSSNYGYILCALLVPNRYYPRVLGN